MAISFPEIRYVQGQTSDKETVKFPLVEIKGIEKGPTFGVIAGMHGGEFCGVEAAVRLCTEIDPANLRGRFLIIPTANISGLLKQVMFVCPEDNKKLSTSFPGKADGSYTEVLAKLIADNFLTECDYVVEFRGGEINETMAHYVSVQPTADKKITELTKRAAHIFGAKNIIYRQQRDKATDHESSYSAGAFMGKIALLAEAGSFGLRPEKDIQFLTKGISNLAQFFGMIKGTPVERTPAECNYINGFMDIKAPATGLFNYLTEVDSIVNPGQVIGRIIDFNGKTLSDIVSPVKGVILGIVSGYGTTEGTTVIGIGTQN